MIKICTDCDWWWEGIEQECPKCKHEEENGKVVADAK